MGTAVALVMLPAEGLAFAALLGAILAPTDAALGLPIFNNARVPGRIGRALNVESGLSDGIATPIVTLFLASAATTSWAERGGWGRSRTSISRANDVTRHARRSVPPIGCP